MEKDRKTIDIKMIDEKPPEHVIKMREIISSTNIPDDEFVLLVAGKKDGQSGYNMFSGYFIGKDVDKREMAKAFFSDLMLLEQQCKRIDIVHPFLVAASCIIKHVKESLTKIKTQHHETNAKQHLS